MLDQTTRTAILRLREEGHGARAIAEALGVSRGAVKRVLRAGTAEVPALVRSELGEAHHDQIIELYAVTKGNLVRVHEELSASGAKLSYQALTAYCRRHGIGYAAPLPAGSYDFEPGKEMQHDTSPHQAVVAGRNAKMQTAALVLGYSRMRFFQHYPCFTRFECKVFLTEGLKYFEGACERCTIDNTHVVVLVGSGRDMVPAPEMAAFAERFGFEFRAHQVGDANRSAHVERFFDHIENNFLAGRSFSSWEELNREARAFCDRDNARVRRHLHASPRELFQAERLRMRPLPLHVPEVYRLHHRIVDTEGYVNVWRNRYSVPWQLIGRRLEVRETQREIELFDGPRLIARHRRGIAGGDERITELSHRPPRGQGSGSVAERVLGAEQRRVLGAVPEAEAYVALLRKRRRGSPRELRWLLRMASEYPLEPLRAALAEALRYGMADLERLERMVLRRVGRDFFVLPRRDDDSDDTENER
jgi:predicted transcriptional regulator